MDPLRLSLAAAAVVVFIAIGVTLMRDEGPLRPVKLAPPAGESAGQRVIRYLGRPFATILLPRWGAYARTVSRWLTNSGRSRETTVEAFTETHIGLIVMSGVVMMWFSALGLLRLGVVVLMIGAITPIVRLASAARNRQAEIERDMPAFLELMAILLASGLTFRHALTRVTARLEGPLSEEMAQLLNELEFGHTPRDALDGLLERSSAGTVKRLVASVRQNDDLGVPIADTLSHMAEDVRAESVVNLKIKAQRAADRAAVVLVFLSVPGALGITLSVIASEALDNFGELLQ